mgnify:CR=1 FL=1
MGTLTTNYKFQKPTPGGDTSTWGNDFTGGDDPAVDDSPGLNGNWSKLDIVLDDIATRLTAAEADVDTLEGIAYLPVGSLHLSTSGTNPATTLGYGTWVAYAAGRALVGVGNNGEFNWTAGAQRGAETHTLTAAQMPHHSHWVDPPSTQSTGAGSHNHAVNDMSSNNTNFPRGTSSSSSLVAGSTSALRSTTSVGDHSHWVDIPGFSSGTAGSDGAHNNIQPSIAVYVWQRTA